MKFEVDYSFVRHCEEIAILSPRANWEDWVEWLDEQEISYELNVSCCAIKETFNYPGGLRMFSSTVTNVGELTFENTSDEILWALKFNRGF